LFLLFLHVPCPHRTLAINSIIFTLFVANSKERYGTEPKLLSEIIQRYSPLSGVTSFSTCIIRCRGTHLCLTPLRIAISSVAVSSTRTIVVCFQYRLLIMRASFSSGPSWFKTSQPIMSHRVKSLFDETGKHIHVHVPTFLDQYLHEK